MKAHWAVDHTARAEMLVDFNRFSHLLNKELTEKIALMVELLMKGYSFPETSEQTGIPLEKIRHMYYRLRPKLRKWFERKTHVFSGFIGYRAC
jgi:DNA-directed RNA polymerase specialized sigma24 family protein